ncbi:repressor of yield of DENV family protein [Geomonas sp. Red69]|uniref:repressor of yield of DENV family protein n=1 Tax=Geomonas diazotrophica TaxID=2843197 RepID=UPI001C10C508|nr:repressor of yield of DENV family protein [Geomonas diazotrophica]MBU5636540.1 repressor of yield of DENV family protein [Geomonas diazotrophica]
MSMRKNQLTSAMALISFVISMGLFSLGLYSLESLGTCMLILLASIIALVVSFFFIGSLRCEYCGKKLEIELFPSYNPLPKFFLWTGAEARCSRCHEKV